MTVGIESSFDTSIATARTGFGQANGNYVTKNIVSQTFIKFDGK
jgi:hypothetical protein